MRDYLREDFKRAIFSASTLIAFIMCTICIFYALYSSDLASFNENKNAATLFFLINESNKTIFPIFSALIATIPYSSSYVVDKKSGAIKNIYIRLDRRKYIYSRVIVNSVIGGGVLALSLILALIISLLIYRNYPISVVPEFFINSGAFHNIHNNYPLIYALIMIWNYFVLGAIFSFFGLVASMFVENEYFAIAFPFLFAVLESALATAIGFEKIFSVIYLAHPLFYTNSTVIGLVLQQIGITSVILIILNAKILKSGDKNV